MLKRKCYALRLILYISYIFKKSFVLVLTSVKFLQILLILPSENMHYYFSNFVFLTLKIFHRKIKCMFACMWVSSRVNHCYCFVLSVIVYSLSLSFFFFSWTIGKYVAGLYQTQVWEHSRISHCFFLGLNSCYVSWPKQPWQRLMTFVPL